MPAFRPKKPDKLPDVTYSKWGIHLRPVGTHDDNPFTKQRPVTSKCHYCGRGNNYASTECEGCGAPL